MKLLREVLIKDIKEETEIYEHNLKGLIKLEKEFEGDENWKNEDDGYNDGNLYGHSKQIKYMEKLLKLIEEEVE